MVNNRNENHGENRSEINVTVISPDIIFAGMLCNELAASGFPAIRLSAFPKKSGGAGVFIVDLDAGIQVPSYHRNIIGWSYNENQVSEAELEKLTALLHRPFRIRELCMTVKDIITTNEKKADTTKDRPDENNTVRQPRIYSDSVGFYYGDVRLELTGTETAVLTLLYEHIGTAVSRKELESVIGGGGNIVEVYICRLRSQFKKFTDIPVIVTVRNSGYMLKT